MKTITIKIIQWSDIKQWWLDRFGVRTIKSNAREMCDFIDGIYGSKIEEIIEKHYGDLWYKHDPGMYNDFILDMKEVLHEACKKAKEIIHV